MLDFSNFYSLDDFQHWHAPIKAAIDRHTSFQRHADLPGWLVHVDKLPSVIPSKINLQSDTIEIGKREDLSSDEHITLEQHLRGLIPWRKGPFKLFGTHIDSEWRSDWKWQRLENHISALSGRRALDVGCGNGYHCWRMLGAGAAHVIGIDPSPRFLAQHLAINKYIQSSQFDFLPVACEDLPTDTPHFDTVFSMGVLYHRREPHQHIKELLALLRPGGELILETLIVDHADNGILVPESRYAKMRNVWNLFTVNALTQLLESAELTNIRCVDINTTSLQEQHATDWMTFQSLRDFLDPNDLTRTVEGYPAPKRAIMIANKA